jgi:hypothetical protein
MKIGNLEVQWHEKCSYARDARIHSNGDKDLSGAFAVADTEPLWRAIHQALDELEMEMIEAARRYTKSTNECIAAVGAGEGVAMVRLRLIEKRENALRERG